MKIKVEFIDSKRGERGIISEKKDTDNGNVPCGNCGEPIHWDHELKMWRHTKTNFADCEMKHAQPIAHHISGENKDNHITIGFQFKNDVYDYMTCDNEGNINISDAFARSIKEKILVSNSLPENYSVGFTKQEIADDNELKLNKIHDSLGKSCKKDQRNSN